MSLSINKNALITITFLLFLKVNVSAQRQLSIGLNAGSPKSGYRFLLAPELRYQFNVEKHFLVPLTVGYTRFKPNFIAHEKGGATYEYITAKAGLKYFFNKNGYGAYGLAEAGAAFGTKSNGLQISGAKSDEGTALVFSPALGYAWNNGLDIAAKYEGYANTYNVHYIGVRLAYGIKF